MSKPDARVVATTCANHVAGETGYVTFHSRVRFGVDLAPLSLLAEAESLIVALQSRLDVVAGLAEKWDSECLGFLARVSDAGNDYIEAAIYKFADATLRISATELRAALGGESPANEEERK